MINFISKGADNKNEIKKYNRKDKKVLLNSILYRKYKFWIIKYFSCRISTCIFVTIIQI